MNFHRIFAPLLITHLSVVVLGDFSRLVEIEQGTLRGSIKKDYDGGDFYSFLSVPYAKKPIGKLRFMMPEAPDKWDGILEATEDMPICLQKDWFGNIIGQEDCLYLNVHTPELVTKDLKPVMVFIHGGGFVEGNGRNEMFGAEFLMPEKVVLVTINYRLGLFGFLNFENNDIGIYGNMGLKDQNMALRWIQKNIEFFGGDPKSVTIFGESAGGASVHFHLISPMSQGLFHKVSALSGSALSPWSTIGQRNTGVFAAKFLGFQKSEREMLHFLQEAPIEDIIKVQENATLFIPLHEPCIGSPIVENIKDQRSFLPDLPINLISSKNFAQVPFMLGFTDEEAIIFDVIPLVLAQGHKDFSIDRAIFYDFNIKDENIRTEMKQLIQKFYNKNGGAMDRQGIFNLVGDIWLYWGILKSARAHAKISHQDLYLYTFSADTELNYFKRLHPVTSKYKGASHLDDLGYLFKTKYTPEISPGSIEEKSMRRVVKLWTNFAKYGDPTPKFEEFNLRWKPVEEDALKYLLIGTKGLSLEIDPFSERVAFWDKIEEDYGKGGKKRTHTEL